MRHCMLFLTTIMTVILSFGHGASAQTVAATATNAAAEGAALDAYKIGPEDVLAITVWKNEPMSRVVQVRPDGMISLPLIDDVFAAGLTPVQFRDVLVKRMSEFIPNPEVSVIVTDVRNYKVSVLGEVMYRPARTSGANCVRFVSRSRRPSGLGRPQSTIGARPFRNAESP